MAILSKIATNVAPIFLEIIVKILQMKIPSKIGVRYLTLLPFYRTRDCWKK